jgi:spore coat polysaccharide biosynthesis predicted glycosyltransferase SpsG
MKIINCKIDNNCMVESPSIHDGFLLGIHFEDDKTCCLSFRSVSSERVNYILYGVTNFKADNFRAGNIVSEIFVFKGNEIPSNRFDQLLFDGGILQDSYIKQIKEEAARLDLLFFELNPSYGCKIQALCDAVECKRA